MSTHAEPLGNDRRVDRKPRTSERARQAAAIHQFAGSLTNPRGSALDLLSYGVRRRDQEEWVRVFIGADCTRIEIGLVESRLGGGQNRLIVEVADKA